jgi:DNA-directed RNA polymerase III subunit RPC6
MERPPAPGEQPKPKRPKINVDLEDLSETAGPAAVATSGPAAGSAKGVEKPDVLVLAACRAKSGGATQEDLLAACKLPLAVILECLNALMSQGLINLMQSPTGDMLFEAVASEKAAMFQGLTPDDRLIYQLISESGNRGIWIKYLKSKSNIATTRIPKILAALEKRKLIKTVKSADAGKKKVYMLYHLELPRKFDFTPERVQFLSGRCKDYIAVKRGVHIEEIATHLKSSGGMPEDIMGKIEFTTEDVQALVDCLVYDGEVEEFIDPRKPGRNTLAYKINKLQMPLNGLTEIPCGRCPVFDRCSDTGDVTPLTCEYYTQWLAQDF